MKTNFQRLAIRRRFWAIGFAALALVAIPFANAKKDPYIFRFGLMAVNGQGKPAVYLETTEIEKHADPSYSHGFTIERRNGSQFFYYFRVRFPEPLTNLPAEAYERYKVSEGGRILESYEELVWSAEENFVFDEADPIGLYEMEIFIDGELYRKVNYNV
ncbi:MAG: hypothetical protein CBD18_02925, partial [Opitutales bacterium TMED158]